MRLLLLLAASLVLTEPREACCAEPNVEAKPYTLTASVEPQAAAVNESRRYAITIATQAPWVIKSETPFSATLTAPAGVTLGKVKLDAKDFVDAKAPVKVAATTITASSAGTHTVDAELVFFVCSAEICKRHKDRVSVTLTAR